jgi:hypothetical protein
MPLYAQWVVLAPDTTLPNGLSATPAVGFTVQ